MNFRILVSLSLFVWSAYAAPDMSARALYERTDYEASLQILTRDPSPGADGYALMGKDYYMLGNYGTAAQFFEKALSLAPHSSEFELWLGRSCGRRAETGSWILALPNASRARQHFEKAAALDPRNPRQIAPDRPAESHFEMAAIAEHRKSYSEAETHLRRAMELSPGQVGRVLDLARFLARRGRATESDVLFEQAGSMAPNDPRVLFARAKTYVEQRRNPDETRRLLRQYLESSLTPDFPPRAEAEKLLHQASR